MKGHPRATFWFDILYELYKFIRNRFPRKNKRVGE